MTTEQRKKLDEAKRLLAEVEQEMGRSVQERLATSQKFDEKKWVDKWNALPVRGQSSLPYSDAILGLFREIAGDRGSQTALMFASLELGRVEAARKALEALDEP